MEKMIGKYVIIDLKKMDYMKSLSGKFRYYDTEIQALETCGIYEFEDVWILQLVNNYIEEIK